MKNALLLFYIFLSVETFSQQNDTSLNFYKVAIVDSTNLKFVTPYGDSVFYNLNHPFGPTVYDTIYSPVWYTSATLSINEVTAKIFSSGPYFCNNQDSVYSIAYTVPNTIPNASSKRSIFSHNIWLGGISESGQLHMTAETYRQGGESFWHGPIANNYDDAYDQKYNKVWKIDKDTIDYHIANYESPGYAVPQQLQDWPAHGNFDNGEAAALAPYVNVAGSWKYEPSLGDYPKIEGDQALFTICNDDRIDPYAKLSRYQKTGVEIHALFYAFNCDEVPSLNQSTFVNYTLFNRSEHDYTDFKIGMNTDFDLGIFNDDYIGCDTNLNIFYCYNKVDTNSNLNSYGINPPAIGLKYLNEDITNFIFYYNDFTRIGNPLYSFEAFNYMYSKWKDGNPLTYGGNGSDSTGVPTTFMYPSNPNDTLGWSMYQHNISNWDMRGLGSIAPFNFESGSVKVLNTSFVFAWDSTITGLENVNLLLENSQHIQDFYDGLLSTSCTEFSGDQESVDVLAHNSQPSAFNLYPNPANNEFYLVADYIGPVHIYNALGQDVYKAEKNNVKLKINSENWNKGVYFIKCENTILKIVIDE